MVIGVHRQNKCVEENSKGDKINNLDLN